MQAAPAPAPPRTRCRAQVKPPPVAPGPSQAAAAPQPWPSRPPAWQCRWRRCCCRTCAPCWARPHRRALWSSGGQPGGVAVTREGAISWRCGSASGWVTCRLAGWHCSRLVWSSVRVCVGHWTCALTRSSCLQRGPPAARRQPRRAADRSRRRLPPRARARRPPRRARRRRRGAGGGAGGGGAGCGATLAAGCSQVCPTTLPTQPLPAQGTTATNAKKTTKKQKTNRQPRHHFNRRHTPCMAHTWSASIPRLADPCQATATHAYVQSVHYTTVGLRLTAQPRPHQGSDTDSIPRRQAAPRGLQTCVCACVLRRAEPGDEAVFHVTVRSALGLTLLDTTVGHAPCRVWRWLPGTPGTLALHESSSASGAAVGSCAPPHRPTYTHTHAPQRSLMRRSPTLPRCRL